jgi:hypothetical protein
MDFEPGFRCPLPGGTDVSDFPAVSRLDRSAELPDPLTTFDGDPVESAEEWRQRRRPEVERLLRHYVYGYAPGPPGVEVLDERTVPVLDGDAVLTEVELGFAALPEGAPTVDLALFLPADADGVPTFVGLTDGGTHSVLADESVTVTDSGRHFGDDERGSRADAWPVQRIVERGYGLAVFHQADVDPDHDDFTDGVHPYYDATDLPGPQNAQWGTIAAWAWGIQRVVDYLRTDDRVDPDGIGVIGHSRRGKTALLAGATDERIALVVPHQSGTGGTTLSRENDEETVASINRVFPHWFNDLFPAFGGREECLPLDQHFLVSLVAPRPLLDTQGARDHWINPGRSLDSLRAAAPVWELLGSEGVVDGGLLYEGDPITDDTAGDLLQYRRETGHVLESGYWEVVLDFSDLHLG